MKKWISIFAFFFFTQCYAAQQLPWNEWVAQLRQEAIQQGIRPQVFDDAFQGIHQPQKKVLHLDRTQPEKRITYLKYRNTRGDAYRIKLGVKYYNKNRTLLNEIGNHYGVNPCYIVSFWGLESSYGHYKGNFYVIQALATLAYDNRRSDYFRKELLYALRILNEGHIKKENFKGEWAGASGHPQFMPSNWYRFAVDYNNDGKKDIWNNYGDVFASIANFLKKNGWQSNQPWGLEVKLPYNFNSQLLSSKIIKPISEWRALGVQPATGWQFPSENLEASIIHPYGGPDMMIFKNFRVMARYNPSVFYRGTICYIADSICQKVHS